MAEPLLKNIRDAAAMMAVSEKTVWNQTSPRGPIPCVRLGKSVRYSVEALREFIAKQSDGQST